MGLLHAAEPQPDPPRPKTPTSARGQYLQLYRFREAVNFEGCAKHKTNGNAKKLIVAGSLLSATATFSFSEGPMAIVLAT